MLKFFKRKRDPDPFTSLLWAIYIETATRFTNRRSGAVNFSEFINNCFPYIEAIRKALIAFEYRDDLSSEERQFVKELTDLTKEINAFTDKWAGAYTGWLSLFKSRSKEAKTILHRSNEWIYEEFQSFYPKSEDLHDDADRILAHLTSLIEFCNKRLEIDNERTE